MGIYSELTATFSQEVADLLPGDTASVKKQSFTNLLDSMGEFLSTVQLKCHKRNVQVVGDWDSVFMIHEVLQSWMALQTNVKLEVDHSEGEMDTNHEDCQIINPSIRLASDANTGNTPSVGEGLWDSLPVCVKIEVPVDPCVLNEGDSTDMADVGKAKHNDNALDKTIPQQGEQQIKEELLEIPMVDRDKTKELSPEAYQLDIEDNKEHVEHHVDNTTDSDYNPQDESTKRDLASDQTSEGDTADTDGEPRTNSVLPQRTKCLKCNYCGETFTTNASCKYHKMKKHLPQYVARLQHRMTIKPPSNKQNCPECYMLVDSFELLVQHFEAVHVNKNPLDEMTEENIFQCSVCIYSCDNRMRSKEHCQRVHWAKQFECSYCGKSFGTERFLNGHIKKIHKDVELACNLCGVLLKGKVCLKNHIERIHEGKPRQHLTQKHLCGICGKSCWSTAELRDHTNKHKDIKAHKCVTCEKEFYLKSSLRLHIKQTHKTTKDHFVCETCGKIFLTRCSVKNHVKLVHSSKNEQCGQCGKQFVNGSTLARHMRTHTGFRPYPCQLCGKAFNDYSILRRHLLGVHKTDDRSLCKKAQ